MIRLLIVVALMAALSSAQSIDKILPEISADSPGAAVLLRRNGRTTEQRVLGVRDLRASLPISARTNFRLASITKQFTAMAIMLLVHDGRLRYETRLPDLFPDFPRYGHDITIRHLLQHTSGLPDYEELMEHATQKWTSADQIKDADVLKLLESAQKGKFAPGTRWSYSNSGYVLLGLVVAKAAGTPFDEFLSKRVFAPLGMRGTVAYEKGKNEVPERAFGHAKSDDGRLVERDQSSTSATLGDGGVYSNLEDLAKWDDALSRHILLSAEEMKPATTPLRLADGSQPHWDSGPGDSDPLAGKAVAYGFGWFLDPYDGHRRMWHYGDTVGFQTSIQRFPDEKITVIVLLNRSDIDPTELALRIAKPYLPLKK